MPNPLSMDLATVTPVLTQEERFPHLFKRPPAARPDHRGKNPAALLTATEQYEAIRANATPRGGLDRPVRSRADADRVAARQAAAQSQGTALRAESAAQGASIEALRELVLAQGANIEALGATVEQLRADVATLSGSVA